MRIYDLLFLVNLNYYWNKPFELDRFIVNVNVKLGSYLIFKLKKVIII